MATLRAILKTEGASAYLSIIKNVTDSNRAAEKSVRALEVAQKAAIAAGTTLEAQHRAAVQASKVHVTQMAADSNRIKLTGALSVINKTAFAAGQATTAAASTVAAAGKKITMSLGGVGQAARGAAASFGGLGALGPVVEAITSPVGIAALALGGLALAVREVWKEYDEFANRDIRDKLAAETGAVKVAAAEWNAFYDALARGDDETKANSERILAGTNAAFGENRARAIAEIDRLEESNERLGKTSLLGLSESDIAVIVKQIDDQNESIRLLRGSLKDMAKDTGSVANAAKDHAEAESKRSSALKKSADEAKRLREELEKARLARVRKIIGRMQDSGMVGKIGGEQVTPSNGAAASIGMGVMRGSIQGLEASAAARAKQQAAMSSIAGSAGLAGSVAMSAASGNPLQAAATIITASEGFQKAIAPVNDMLQRFADAIGEPLAVVSPLLEHLAEATRPLLGVLQVANGILTRINPAFLILSVSLRAAAGAAKIIGDAFINGALGLLRAIKALLPKRLEPKWLNDSIKSLKKFRDTVDEVSEALGAILPEGYKLLELRRFNADPGIQNPYGGTGGSGGGSDLPTSMYPSIDAPPGYHWAWVNGAWRLVENGSTSSSTGSSATSGSSGNGATSTPSLAGATIILQGVQSESELWTKLRRMGQREATVRTGRASYVSGAT